MFIYAMVSIMPNITAEKEGVCAVVLIRSCAPTAGTFFFQFFKSYVSINPIVIGYV